MRRNDGRRGPPGRAGVAAAALLGGSVLLAACGGGGAPSFEPHPGHAREQCEDWATPAAGEYMAENNVWNKRDAAGYTQCVSVAEAGAAASGVDAMFRWDWPVPAQGTRAAPELIFGHKPWYDASTTASLPRVLDDVNGATVSFDRETAHTGAGNLTFDIWLTASNHREAGQAHLPLTHEVMIWLEAFGGLQPEGTRVDTVVIEGITWDLYQTTADWGPVPWTYVAYLPRTALRYPLHLDLKPFFDHLQARGTITGQEWLASIEIGNEVVNGRGWTELYGYTVQVD